MGMPPTCAFSGYFSTHPGSILCVTIFHYRFLRRKGPSCAKEAGRQPYIVLLPIAPVELLCLDPIAEVLAHSITRRDVVSAAVGVFAEELGGWFNIKGEKTELAGDAWNESCWLYKEVLFVRADVFVDMSRLRTALA